MPKLATLQRGVIMALLLGSVLPVQATGPTVVHDPALKSLDLTSTFVPDIHFDNLAAKASKDGVVHVIVTFPVVFTPEGKLSTRQALAQRANIIRVRTAVKAALSGTDHKVTREYKSVPSIALSLSLKALRKLQASGLAASVQEDQLVYPFLASSGPIVESTAAAAAGLTGLGHVVAVLDTGVDKDHVFIDPSQVSNEACFASGSDGVGPVGDCPNGASTMIGVGSGEDCTFSGDCDHGTHVAGIAMGGAHVSSPGNGAGVGRSAGVIPVQVFSNFSGSAGSWFSDINAALDYVVNLPPAVRNTISAVNMSLGGRLFTSACDASFTSTKLLIDNLLSVGTATVIASGNSGSNSGVSAPGCISTAVTVGATDDFDNVAGFSNSSPLVDLLAIGVDVTSSIPDADPPLPGPPPYASFNGTSMATPMIAGAFTVMDQVFPGSSVSDQLTQLQNTGLPVMDPDNGVIRPRLRLFTATGAPPPPPPPPTCGGAISIPGGPGIASPYPSNCVISGLGTFVTDVNVTLTGLSHTFPSDIDILLVGPSGANTIVLSNVGGSTDVVNITLTLDDSGAVMPTPLVSGTFVPTNFGIGDLFPGPAPLPSGGSALSVFNGTDPNGTWSLYVIDDLAADSGGITSWDLTITASSSPPPPSPVLCRGILATIVGTPGNDILNGTPGRDIIAGLGGNDIIRGFNGNDLICAGLGNDIVHGGNGRDGLYGEGGRDALNGNAGNDRLNGGPNTDICRGGTGIDTASSCEVVTSVP